MVISRENPEDLEKSIKSRANEVFSDANDVVPIKSFTEYLGATPAAPLSPELKALLWVTALIVAMLFAGAIFQIQRGRRRPRSTPPPTPKAATPAPARAATIHPKRRGADPEAESGSPAVPRIGPRRGGSPPAGLHSASSTQVPNSGRRAES